jgi:predicted TIM-barrel fold metal-dependent hydrolase
MKALALLVTVGITAGIVSCQSASAQKTPRAIVGPFSSEELPNFRALEPIDTHAHVFAADPAFTAMLKKLNLHILDVLVVNDMTPGHNDLAKLKQEAWDVAHNGEGYVALCTTWDPYSFSQQDFAQNAVRGLNEDFANGAIAVKLWKNVGMEIKDANGKYLMPDDPVFEPIFQDIQAQNKTLLAHVADPDSGWQKPNPKSPDFEYYRDNPKAYMYGKSGVPNKAEILQARDRMLEKNPSLRVVGAHLGSMESNLTDLGGHLDRYPNFAVDIAARMPYFEMRKRETMIAFITRYQDRLIYGTDIEFSGEPNKTMVELEDVYANDWRYFATSDVILYKGKPVQGLNLPAAILRKIYHENAVKWFPGIVGAGQR